MQKDKKIRIQKYLSDIGAMSRRAAEREIVAGNISVNGITSKLGDKIDPDIDAVLFGGMPVVSQNKKYYILLNKPAGYITTAEDEKGRKTIYDIIPPELKKLKPVGRLDKDSTGLIIMTNDGELINEMTHPSIKVPKVYLVSINGKLTPEHGEKMYNGFEIETDTGEKKMAYAQVLPIELGDKSSTLQVTLHQGINRQIRKMFAVLGFEVVSLKRVQHGTITLEGLKKGQIKLKIR
mgnify:CR=1 FL=1